MIHQTRPPSFIVPWFSADVHMPLGNTLYNEFCMCTMTDLRLCIVIDSKISSSISCRLNQISGGIRPDKLDVVEPWVPIILSLLPWLSFLGPLLAGTPHKACHFGKALTQSSSYNNLGLVEVTPVLTLLVRPCSFFQTFHFKN